MSCYPILVCMEGKKVLVVGGGMVAQRKIETLLEYKASVHVVSRDVTSALRMLAEGNRIHWMGREYDEESLEGVFMVIAATDDPGLNHRVSEDAKRRGMLINAVDQPRDCNFIVPSTLRRGDLVIAVSTSGKSPALAKKIREKLEEDFGKEYAPLLVLMGRLRREVISRGLSQLENKQIFQDLLDSPILEGIARKDWKEVTEIVNRIMKTRLSYQDMPRYLEDE